MVGAGGKGVMDTQLSPEQPNSFFGPHGKRRLPEILLGLLLVGYFVLFMALIHQRYLALELYDVNDTAANMQTVWSVVHGPFFTTTIQHYLQLKAHNVLGDQLYFCLLLYLPFWLLYPSPWVFVTITVLAAALSAVPLFALAKSKLQDPGASLAVAAAYLFNNVSYNTYFLFGFRPEALALPLVFAAFWALDREKFKTALLFFAGLLLVKHDGILILAMTGLYLGLGPRPGRRFGLLLIALSVLYFLGVVQPLFSHFSYTAAAYYKGLDHFGKSPAAALLALALHPGLFFHEVSPLEIRFLLFFFFHVGFLCLWSPRFYIGLPLIGYNLLQADYGSLHCGWHWTLVVPFAYLGAVDAWARLVKRYGGTLPRRAILFGTIFMAAVFVVEAGGLFKMAADQRSLYYRAQQVDTGKMIDAARAIPPEASVCAAYRMLWFTCFRQEVYYNCDEKRMRTTDYVVVTLPLKQGIQGQTDPALVKAVGNHNSVLYQEFAPVVTQPNLTIYKRKTATPAGPAP